MTTRLNTVNRRDALIGLAVYKGGKVLLKRMSKSKGGALMASKKRIGIVAAVGAALGALMFWRRKKRQQQEFFQS